MHELSILKLKLDKWRVQCEGAEEGPQGSWSWQAGCCLPFHFTGDA